MLNREKIKYVLLSVAAVACIVVMVSLVMAGRNKSNVSYREVIEAKDETIKLLKEQRDMYVPVIEKLEASIIEHEKQDSLLNIMYLNNRKNYIINDNKMSAVKSRIERIANNNDSLRAAISAL